MWKYIEPTGPKLDIKKKGEWITPFPLDNDQAERNIHKKFYESNAQLLPENLISENKKG